MENNGQNNGKVTETYRVLPGYDMWAMINQHLASKHKVSTQFHFASNEGIKTPFEKGKNTAITYVDLTGTPDAVASYIDALSKDGSGNDMDVFEKYP